MYGQEQSAFLNNLTVMKIQHIFMFKRSPGKQGLFGIPDRGTCCKGSALTARARTPAHTHPRACAAAGHLRIVLVAPHLGGQVREQVLGELGKLLDDLCGPGAIRSNHLLRPLRSWKPQRGSMREWSRIGQRFANFASRRGRFVPRGRRKGRR